MRPASAGMKPPMMCRKVLLPQPLGPMMEMNSPSRAAKASTSRMSSGRPSLANVFLIPEACRATVLTTSLVPQRQGRLEPDGSEHARQRIALEPALEREARRERADLLSLPLGRRALAGGGHGGGEIDPRLHVHRV